MFSNYIFNRRNSKLFFPQLYSKHLKVCYNKEVRRLTAIDLFCGVGGLTYGLQKSGIDVIAGVDNDSTCQYAYEKNNKTKFIKQDIKEVTKDDINKLFKKNDIKILVGCAPCQTFSTHSTKIKKRKKIDEDQRWHLLDDFARLVQEIKPDIVSMENVPLLQKQNVFDDFLQSLKNCNFHVSYSIVDCSKYGIPQKRRRLVLLASRFGEINLLKPGKNITSKNVGDVIRNLQEVSAGEQLQEDPLHFASNLNESNLKRIKNSKPGGTWRDWSEDLLVDCHKRESGATYSSVYGRMEWDKPGPTITTQFHRYGTGRFGHPEQHRAISLREGAILQTFPKRYRFAKGKKFSSVIVAKHIGNAVPPKLAEIIGKSIKKHIA